MLKLFILKDNKSLPWVLLGEIYVEVVDSSVYVKITEQASRKYMLKFSREAATGVLVIFR